MTTVLQDAMDVGKENVVRISSYNYGRPNPYGVKDMLSRPKTAFGFNSYMLTISN